MNPELVKAIKEGLGAGLIFRTRELMQELQKTLFGYYEWPTARRIDIWQLRDAVRVMPDEPVVNFYEDYIKQCRRRKKGTAK